MTSWPRYILIFFIISAVSCGEESFPLTIGINLIYDGHPLVILQDYEYPDGKTIRFTRVSFYISDLAISSNGTSEQLVELDHVNLTQSHVDMAGALHGLNYFEGDVSFSAIDRISFNIGIPLEANQTVPADYQPGHPLANSGEYWIGWESYIFAKIEGWVDLDGDGDAETSMALHLGSNDVMRHVDLDVQSNLDDIRLEIDVRKVFEQKVIYDIGKDPQIHSLSQLDAALELAENFSNAFKVK